MHNITTGTQTGEAKRQNGEAERQNGEAERQIQANIPGQSSEMTGDCLAEW